MTKQEHIDYLLTLDEKERLSIANLLWQSLESEKGILDAEKEMLDERKRKYLRGEVKADSWQNVKKRLLNR